MNEKKLQRMIQDASELLDLTDKQTNYLDMLINLAYNLGQLDKAREVPEMLENLKEKII